MLFHFPFLIVCMCDLFLKAIWHWGKKHVIPWEHSYLSHRFLLFIKLRKLCPHEEGRTWRLSVKVCLHLLEIRICLKACVVSRDTLTRSTLSDVLLTFSGSFAYAWTRCGCYTRSVATLGIDSFSLLTDSHEQGYWFESLTMDFCQCSLRTGSR